jgi:hypothetical protein
MDMVQAENRIPEAILQFWTLHGRERTSSSALNQRLLHSVLNFGAHSKLIHPEPEEQILNRFLQASGNSLIYLYEIRFTVLARIV